MPYEFLAPASAMPPSPQGLGATHLVVHHGKRYLHNNISGYDLNFCRHHGSTLQGQRHWNIHNMLWEPEMVDLPASGESCGTVNLKNHNHFMQLTGKIPTVVGLAI